MGCYPIFSASMATGISLSDSSILGKLLVSVNLDFRMQF